MKRNITKKDVQEYYQYWAGGKDNDIFRVLFADMLQKKCVFAREHNTTVMAYNKKRNGNEFELMLELADELFTR